MRNLILPETEAAWVSLRVTDYARIIGQTGLAWLLALIAFHGGLLLGLG